jgi:PAS domain S-box-containing protein
LVKPFDEKELHTTIEVALLNCRMETKLRESEEWLSAILRCIGDGVIATDKDLMVRFLNPIAEAMTGCSGRDALGKHLSLVFKVSDDGSGTLPSDPALQAVQENAPVSSRGAVHVSQDGTRRILDITAWPIRAVDASPRGVVLASRDITEYRRASAALAEQAKELARSNQELERFAYVASHDLQEPLRMVSSYVQLLARRYQGKLDADADDFIRYIVDGSERMQRFIRDLLAYSRASSEKREVGMVDSEQILQQALRNLSTSIRDSGATVTHDPLPSVACDPTQLLQLFQNLLSNGIKFRGLDAPRIHVSAAAESGRWLFSVSDNGVGIDPRDQERIFMIFERGRTSRDTTGAGMGLAICKKIVDGHHGGIWVDSRPGEGSTFKFTIPMGGGERPANFHRNAEEERQ